MPTAFVLVGQKNNNNNNRGTGIGGLMRVMTTLAQDNQELGVKKKFVVSGNPTDPSFYPPTLKILWTYLC